MPLDQGGQLDRQLVQIGDVQEGIAVDAFDAGFIVADGCGDEENVLSDRGSTPLTSTIA